MIFTSPLGLLALLAIPAIVAIHLFRRRFPPRPVAGLFLWQAVQQTPQGGGRISKLPVTASLILECLAALALALILSGARLNPASVNEHLIFLLDDSASMAAVNARNQSPRDRAVQRVRGRGRTVWTRRARHADTKRRTACGARRTRSARGGNRACSRKMEACNPSIIPWLWGCVSLENSPARPAASWCSATNRRNWRWKGFNGCPLENRWVTSGSLARSEISPPMKARERSP